jgi:hypothetical protein
MGEGSYTSDALEVPRYEKAILTFWRGPLVGGGGTFPFRAYFEESQDGVDWYECDCTPTQPVTTTNTSEVYTIPFRKRWFRVRVALAANGSNVVAISTWLAGVLELREGP